MDLMPMVDIIFQLLIFFLLSAKFIAFEGQLQAYLPKDRGDQSTPAEIELASLDLYLGWDKEKQKVVCIADETPDGGKQQYPFPDDPNDRQRATEGGGTIVETVTVMGLGERAGKVAYDYRVPDFPEIERYMIRRKDNYSAMAPGKTLPVNVTFTDSVPWQMVVNLLDISDRLGITDFSINAEAID